jgi:hypothetical protein
LVCGSGTGSLRAKGPKEKLKKKDISYFEQLDVPSEGLEAFLVAFKSSIEV